MLNKNVYFQYSKKGNNIAVAQIISFLRNCHPDDRKDLSNMIF